MFTVLMSGCNVLSTKLNSWPIIMEGIFNNRHSFLDNIAEPISRFSLQCCRCNQVAGNSLTDSCRMECSGISKVVNARVGGNPLIAACDAYSSNDNALLSAR